MNIVQSLQQYEEWLEQELEGRVVRADLQKKHEKMAAGAFQFLRATYWRWAETILATCPELGTAPSVLCVGDVHVENFGSWRDGEGRLVWGVNDFDEAASMPYCLDLVRLAVSAMLAPGAVVTHRRLCVAILKGYREGLEEPRPYILDRQHSWLRRRLEVTDSERREFCKKLEKMCAHTSADRNAVGTSKLYRRALAAALPEGSGAPVYWPRAAGTGSLGRPRYVCCASWQGAPVIREAKAVVRSAWCRFHGGGEQVRCVEVARGRYRSFDPSYHVSGNILTRRLAPDDRKIELSESLGDLLVLVVRRHRDLLDARILRAMGHELASIHLGAATDPRASIIDDLRERRSDWLPKASARAARQVNGEHQEWRRFVAQGTRAQHAIAVPQ